MTFNILALNCSGRKEGYTASVLSRGVEGIKKIESAEVDTVHLHEYEIKPCISCFECVKNPGNGCVIDDSMGKEGELWKKTKECNGLMIADPVHMWSSSTGCHLFLERLYPYLWTGEINGLPFAYFSCASNQGFHRFSAKEICRRAIPYSLRLIGTLPVHTAYLEKALTDAKELGKKLAKAAKKDAEEGRQIFDNELEKFKFYQDKISPAFEIYLENLMNGSDSYDKSVFPPAEKSFEDKDAKELLDKAIDAFKETLEAYNAGDMDRAIEKMVETGDYWTNATWKEYLEKNVIGSEQPKAYRPLEKEK